jgi:hypothetical protein
MEEVILGLLPEGV